MNLEASLVRTDRRSGGITVPTYMDRHDGVTVTPEELAGAHAMDVAV